MKITSAREAWRSAEKRNGGALSRTVVNRLIAALEPDDVVLGGGNVRKLKVLPKGCREGNNANAFLGGFRLWEKADKRRTSIPHKDSLLLTTKEIKGVRDDKNNRAAH